MKTNNDLEKEIKNLEDLLYSLNTGNDSSFNEFLEFLTNSDWVLKKQSSRFVDDGEDFGWKIRIIFTRCEETFRLRFFTPNDKTINNGNEIVFSCPIITRATYYNDTSEKYSFDGVNLALLFYLSKKS